MKKSFFSSNSFAHTASKHTLWNRAVVINDVVVCCTFLYNFFSVCYRSGGLEGTHTHSNHRIHMYTLTLTSTTAPAYRTTTLNNNNNNNNQQLRDDVDILVQNLPNTSIFVRCETFCSHCNVIDARVITFFAFFHRFFARKVD